MCVLVDQVDGEKQVALREHLARLAVGHHGVVLREHDDAVGRLRRGREVVRGHHHRAALALPLVEHVEQPDLAARVERAGRLVEQQHARVHGDDGGDGDALLLAARERVRRAVEELVDAQVVRDLGDEALDLVPRQAELQRPEGELVADVGAEQLDVRILEHEPHPGAEVAAVGGVLERVLGERRAEGEDLPGAGEDEPVEHLEERGLAGAVGSDDRHVLAGQDREVDPGERGRSRPVLVADAAQDEVGRGAHAVPRPAASASAQIARLAASHAQSAAPTWSRRSDGIAPV